MGSDNGNLVWTCQCCCLSQNKICWEINVIPEMQPTLQFTYKQNRLAETCQMPSIPGRNKMGSKQKVIVAEDVLTMAKCTDTKVH